MTKNEPRNMGKGRMPKRKLEEAREPGTRKWV
jgi:hypothetical protein